MKKRKNINILIIFIFILTFSNFVYAGGCNYDGTCQIGEDLIVCEDCTNAFCGNGRCDYGKGEDENCPEDCNKPNGASCQNNSECQSNACCRVTTSGVCVDFKYCIPGNTQTTSMGCSDGTVKTRTCLNDCSWSSWSACYYDCSSMTCNDNNPCTDDSCSSIVGCKYVNVAAGTWCNQVPEKYCDGQGNCELKCELAGTGYFCSSSQPSNSVLYTEYYCQSGQCYSCQSGYVLQNGQCVLSCNDECATGDFSCIDSTHYKTCGNFDSDSCRDWSSSQTCPSQTICDSSAKSCITPPQCTQNSDCNDNNACTNDNCVGGRCEYTDVTPECPPSSTVDCGQQITSTNGCGTCQGTGTKCNSGYDCINGQCVQQCVPSTETCNGRDDDCDNDVDENCFCTPGSTQSCYSGREGTENKGVCEVGVQTCNQQGQWGDCVGDVTPSTETCNGEDDDCDNEVDEGNLCSQGYDCINGQCVQQCIPKNCNELGKECGSWGDGCGNQISCGSCPSGDVCTIQGLCKTSCDYIGGICSTSEIDNAVENTSYYCPALGNVCWLCISGYVKRNNQCVLSQYQIIPSPDSVIKVEGEGVQIHLTTKDENNNAVSGVTYTYSGIISGQTNENIVFTTTHSDIGNKQLTIVAKKVFMNTEEIIATKSVPVTVLCGHNSECCIEGEAEYSPDGTSCVVSTGAPGNCQNGNCKPKCSGTFQPESVNYNNCNDNLDNDCDGAVDCQENFCNNAENCRGVTCQPGKINCGGECVDITKDRNNCGGCNRKCKNDETCQEGVCTFVEECFIACDSDSDCGEKEVCAYPGDCFLSQCVPEDAIILPEEVVDRMFLNIGNMTFAEIVKILTKEQFKLVVRNIAPLPLTNINITIEVPKALADSSAKLSSKKRFIVLEDDPKILFTEDEILDEKIYKINLLQPQEIFNPDLVNDIRVFITHDPLNLTPLPISDLTIEREIKKTEEGTTIKLKIDPKRAIKNVGIPIEIPKCLAEHINELNIKTENYKVIQDDPILMWNFDNLKGTEHIEFSVPKDVDEECLAQLHALGFGKIRRSINPMLLLLLIPLVGIALVVFSRYREKGKETISKKEFYKIARKQGIKDIDSAWREYKGRL